MFIVLAILLAITAVLVAAFWHTKTPISLKALFEQARHQRDAAMGCQPDVTPSRRMLDSIRASGVAAAQLVRRRFAALGTAGWVLLATLATAATWTTINATTGNITTLNTTTGNITTVAATTVTATTVAANQTNWCGTCGGTATALTATCPGTVSTGSTFCCLLGFPLHGASTINVNAAGAINVKSYLNPASNITGTSTVNAPGCFVDDGTNADLVGY